MRRRGKGQRGPAAALCGPASSDDEAPQELSFGAAKEAAEAQRRLAGEAARRHRELLKEKRRRRQELFAEQKRRKLLPEAVLQELPAAPPAPARPAGPAAAPSAGKGRGGEAVRKVKKGQRRVKKKKDKDRRGARRQGNCLAVCWQEQSLTGLHQQLAKDFVTAQLYGPAANRAQANEFFSLENKKSPVQKAAVQFVDKSWGQDKKEKAARFKKRWVATQVKN